jgi:hypothetical protein
VNTQLYATPWLPFDEAPRQREQDYDAPNA